MDLHDSKAYSRRLFLERGVALASACTTIPAFMQRSAFAMTQQAGAATSSIPGVPEDRVLVVVQLGGGNDGLNTVIPYRDDAYYRARPRIAIDKDRALTLDRRADVGLHPNMDALKSLYDDGLLSIVQGVGYPNPDRSHFTSMDIWHTAKPSGVGDGWLGRFFDNECAGSPDNDTNCQAAAVSIGEETPLALTGRQTAPVNFDRAELFRWTGEQRSKEMADAYDSILENHPEDAPPDNPTSAFLTRTAMDARVVSAQMRKAIETQPLVSYPRHDLGRQLAMVGSMIRAGMPTRVYYVTLGGFDTHAGQGGENGRHANLLRQFATAMNAFSRDLKKQGNDGRVLTMCFSEFGRRVGQNASNGTDHGTAAPMFLMGPMVRAGVLGNHPSLTDLDQGDLKHRVDFRSVYASVLDKWLGADDRQILGGQFRPAPVLRRV